MNNTSSSSAIVSNAYWAVPQRSQQAAVRLPSFSGVKDRLKEAFSSNNRAGNWTQTSHQIHSGRFQSSDEALPYNVIPQQPSSIAGSSSTAYMGYQPPPAYYGGNATDQAHHRDQTYSSAVHHQSSTFASAVSSSNPHYGSGYGYRPGTTNVVNAAQYGYHPQTTSVASTADHGYRPDSNNIVYAAEYGYQPTTTDVMQYQPAQTSASIAHQQSSAMVVSSMGHQPSSAAIVHSTGPQPSSAAITSSLNHTQSSAVVTTHTPNPYYGAQPHLQDKSSPAYWTHHAVQRLRTAISALLEPDEEQRRLADNSWYSNLGHKHPSQLGKQSQIAAQKATQYLQDLLLARQATRVMIVDDRIKDRLIEISKYRESSIRGPNQPSLMW